MFSRHTLYWAPYLAFSLTASASAASPLDRISRLEHQVESLHQLQADLAPLLERLESRITLLEQRDLESTKLRQEIATLRRSLSELSQRQKLADQRRSGLESELRTARQVVVPQVNKVKTVDRAKLTASPTALPDRTPPQPKLFRAEPVPVPTLTAWPLGPEDAEYWRGLKDKARRSVLASRQRNGLAQ